MSSPGQDRTPFRLDHFVVNLGLRGLIGTALLLPYPVRVAFVGWLMRRVIGPIAGYRTRARENLHLIWPDQSETDRNRIADQVLDNAGRTLIENYSTKAFMARAAEITPEGLGYQALVTARDQKRPVILVSGHFGNYEAARAALVERGFVIGGLYRNLSNRYFNAHYVKTMQAFGGPVFPQGRAGTAGFVRHLKEGGQLVLLFDQDVPGAPALPFLGRPARTALSAAELALRATQADATLTLDADKTNQGKDLQEVEMYNKAFLSEAQLVAQQLVSMLNNLRAGSSATLSVSA